MQGCQVAVKGLFLANPAENKRLMLS